MSDSLVSRGFSPSSIRSQIQKSREPAPVVEELAAGPGSAEKTDPLPRPGDAYRAAGRHGNKPELSIDFVAKDYSYEGFSYADLERRRLVPSDRPGVGPKLVLRFNGSVITEVTLEGRHVQSLYHDIGLHRLPWVWEHPSPAEFTDEKAVVISRITFDVIAR